MDVVIATEDPLATDVQALLLVHLAFAREVTPEMHVHALGVDGLLDSSLTVFGARRDGELLGIGGLRQLNSRHGELKSMHTSQAARRQGVGRAIVVHVLRVATERGYERVSLETGTMDSFAPARALYSAMGFTRCNPFGEYTDNPYSLCMSLGLGGPSGPATS